MRVHYNTRRTGQLIPNYVCSGHGRLLGDGSCQSILGTEIDAAVSKLLVEAVTPMALEMTLAIQQEITQRERKRMLALLIEDITLIKRREITVAIRFRGGATTTLTLPRPLTPQQLRATQPEVRQQIDALLDEYTDAQVANQLNKQQMRTGTGESFDTVSVQWVRFSAKLKSLKERLLEAGWLTSKQVAAQLGVSLSTVSSLRNKGRLKGRICSDKGEWLYWPGWPIGTSSIPSSFDPVHRGRPASVRRHNGGRSARPPGGGCARARSCHAPSEAGRESRG